MVEKAKVSYILQPPQFKVPPLRYLLFLSYPQCTSLVCFSQLESYAVILHSAFIISLGP